jgi:hypothetical protein
MIVHYEEIKRELNRRPMYEYRCDEILTENIYYESMK